jgi:hypothetical protein
MATKKASGKRGSRGGSKGGSRGLFGSGDTTRIARLHIEKGRARSTVTVSVPPDFKPKEFGSLQASLIDRVIRDLTGCPCLSGAVDVIFRNDFEDAIRVDLNSGRIMQ